jgi:threonylcarbamoyladenosine tRNA methylthiotransferase MtaB
MKTFSIHTLGCKVNQYESQQIRELLETLELRRAEPYENPDLVVINTCCVTHTASAKSRQQIRKIQKHHPEAVLVVCGCLPVIKNSSSWPQPDQSDSQSENIKFVPNRDELAAILIQLISRACSLQHIRAGRQITADLYPQSINSIKPESIAKIKLKKGLSENPALPILTCFQGQTRAFLKVQDGCDCLCSYCIIPKTRPDIRSKPVNEAINEAKALVLAGHKEIVITGICLGAYGYKSARRRNNISLKEDYLADLVDKIAQIPHLERIRLSSIEPSDITERLLGTFRKYSNIMPHLHLSLQSGSDAVLKRMCRRYKIDEVRKKIDQIKSLLDRPAITTDIIVGFPGETDENFDETVKFVQETVFAKIHVFRFSPGKDTPAARMNGSIDNKIINNRSKIMRELDKQSGYEFRNQFIGESETILIENANGQILGRSQRYFMVSLKPLDGPELKSRFQKDDLVKVKLLQNTKDGMTGIPVSGRIDKAEFLP